MSDRCARINSRLTVTFTALVLSLIGGTSAVTAQERGNARANAAAYDSNPYPQVSSSGVLTSVESTKDVTPVYFLEALVMINLKADEYVVSFGIAQEGMTARESEQKVDTLITQFANDLGGMGIPSTDSFVDFISQNPIYEFAASSSGKTATEKLVGYQTKKNISVRYRDRSLLRQITNAANRASIFDVIKVDYLINDVSGVRARLSDEAIKVIKRKEGLYKTLDIKAHPVAVVEERFRTFAPDELYQTYTAYESGNTEGYRKIIEKRKTSTSYYKPLDANDFDLAINPTSIEPVVQCTLYLKVKYASAEAPVTAPKGDK